MSRIGSLGCGLAVAALAVALVPAAASAAPTPGHGAGVRPGLARMVPGSLHVAAGGLATAKSTNWSGYVDTKASTGRYTKVSANWTLPKLACTSATAGGFASAWVGIDGDGDNTVEQTGTRMICESSTKTEYVDWWEMYPGGVELMHSTLKAGDKLTGSVTVSGTKYTLAITDHTHSSDSFSVTKTCAKSTCTDATADWVVESHVVSNGVPFPDYGKVTFTKDSVTAGSKTGTISTFPHVAITAVDSSGKANATVSKLTNGGATFSNIWQRSN